MARVFVGMPVMGGYYPQMIASLLKVVQDNPGGHTLHFHPVYNESLISRARSKIASAFLESDCDYLLTVDADLEFPLHALDRMIGHDLDIVAAPYSVKTIPARWAVALGDSIPDYVSGVLPVRYVPGGFTLIKKRVFEKMATDALTFYEEADAKPYYAFYLPYLHTNDAGRQVFLSEDYAFCQRARDLGFEIHCDFDLPLNHWGMYRFNVPEINGKLPSHPLKPIVGEFAEMTSTVEGLLQQPGLANQDQDYAALLQGMMSSFQEVGEMLKDMVVAQEPPKAE